jgi:hypothetical protein
MDRNDPAAHKFIVGRIEREDMRSILFILPHHESRFLLVFDYTVQADGKGSAYAQEMWHWMVERGMDLQRDQQAYYDFMAYVDADLAMEFKVRWM